MLLNLQIPDEVDVADMLSGKPEVIVEIAESEIPTSQAAEIIEQCMQNDNSTSFPFGNTDVQSDMTALYDQSSAGNGEVTSAPHTTDSIDNLLANLAEDNANSLPSGDDDTLFTTAADNHHSGNVKPNTDVIGNGTPTDPVFVTDKIEEQDVNAELKVEVLIAGPVLDNNLKDEKMDVDSSETNSAVAIAEDLPNGGASDNSQSTKVDVDAEMVSEDELPAPSQEKVDDAEEVSDEELPGPQVAELPADTEVVSEDELPTSNKAKRKADEGYDPGSPTESSETPEKKIKSEDADGEGNSTLYLHYPVIYSVLYYIFQKFPTARTKIRKKIRKRKRKRKYCQT